MTTRVKFTNETAAATVMGHLYSAKRIGGWTVDATAADLDAAINHYQAQAASMSRTATWLVLVRNLTPAQGRVGDVVDDATAQRLFDEASK